MQTAARTGSHETQVVAHLAQFDRETLEGRGVADIGTGVRRSLYEVARQFEGFARQFAHLLDAQFGIAGRGVDTRTDCCTAHVDLIEQVDITLEVRDLFFEVVGEGMELLTAGHRHGVLQLGATHLDGVVELVAFLTQRRDEVLQFGLESAVHADEGIAESGGVGVVGTLRAVDVVVG